MSETLKVINGDFCSEKDLTSQLMDEIEKIIDDKKYDSIRSFSNIVYILESIKFARFTHYL